MVKRAALLAMAAAGLYALYRLSSPADTACPCLAERVHQNGDGLMCKCAGEVMEVEASR